MSSGSSFSEKLCNSGKIVWSAPDLCDIQGVCSDAGLDVSLGMFRETIWLRIALQGLLCSFSILANCLDFMVNEHLESVN